MFYSFLQFTLFNFSTWFGSKETQTIMKESYLLKFRVSPLTANSNLGWFNDVEGFLKGKGLGRYEESEKYRQDRVDGLDPQAARESDVSEKVHDRDLALAYVISTINMSIKGIICTIRFHTKA